MIAFAAALWPGLAGALVLGAVVGFAAGLPRDRMSLMGALMLLVSLAVLSGLLIGDAVSGDASLWLDAACLMLATYLIGCLSGALARSIPMRQN